MQQLVLFVLLLSTAVAQRYYYALDLASYGAPGDFACIKQSGYATVFLRAYEPTNGGRPDANVISNIHNAFYAQLGTELFIVPNPSSSKSAAWQVDDTVSNLATAGVTIRVLWLQVTAPVQWSRSTSTNNQFILKALQRIRSKGIIPGIYTSAYDWQQITGNLAGLGSDVRLWYWNIIAPGPHGESSPDWTDFRPFAGFQHPTVKQFGQYEQICRLLINRNVYLVADADAASGASGAPRLPEEVDEATLFRKNKHPIVVGNNIV